MFKFILEILFEILGNLVFVGILTVPIMLGAKECAKKNNRSLWEVLLSED